MLRVVIRWKTMESLTVTGLKLQISSKPSNSAGATFSVLIVRRTIIPYSDIKG